MTLARTGARAGAILAWLVGVFLSSGAGAHVVVGTKTLHHLTSEADLALLARIVRVEEHPGRGEAARERPWIEAEVIEVLKGVHSDPRVRFVQHGHGVAPFREGQESVLFLVDIGRIRELETLGGDGGFAWVSLQEHGDQYLLSEEGGDRIVPAVRAYAQLDQLALEPDAVARDAAARRTNLELLTSGSPQLAASALRDLVLVPATVPIATREELPRLEAVLRDPETSMGVRAGLLGELERRGLVDGTAEWLALLDEGAPVRDRVTAIRAAASRGGNPAVRARLIELLGDPTPAVAAQAAAALGTPGNAHAVEPLVAALGHDSPRVRNAALRGLGRLSLPQARNALSSAAADHPDAETRRRAEAEVRRSASRQGP